MAPLASITLLLLTAQGGSAPTSALLRALAEIPAGGQRAAQATRPLLGMPYQRSALGEGTGEDPDPRFRLDAFDCLTFVETAIALGSSRDLVEAARALDDIRYDGAPALSARHHEMQAQWIPANLAKGWVVDLTVELAGTRAVRLEKEHTAATWAAVHRAGRAVPGLPVAREPIGRFETWAVAPADLGEVGPRIPEGAVIVVLREDQAGRATRISHVGLVVLGAGGERLVRHATSSRGLARVIEEPLSRFTVREARAYPRWPLAGFALLGVPDSTARVASLMR